MRLFDPDGKGEVWRTEPLEAQHRAITALAVAEGGARVAVAIYKRVHLREIAGGKLTSSVLGACVSTIHHQRCSTCACDLSTMEWFPSGTVSSRLVRSSPSDTQDVPSSKQYSSSHVPRHDHVKRAFASFVRRAGWSVMSNA